MLRLKSQISTGLDEFVQGRHTEGKAGCGLHFLSWKTQLIQWIDRKKNLYLKFQSKYQKNKHRLVLKGIIQTKALATLLAEPVWQFLGLPAQGCGCNHEQSPCSCEWPL